VATNLQQMLAATNLQHVLVLTNLAWLVTTNIAAFGNVIL
jgi:hypothetical protein